MKTRVILYCVLIVLTAAAAVHAQTTAFNFQGRLNDGTSPANGRYDLQFKLFDAITGGSQVGATVDRPNTMLVNGVFSTPLDFGSDALAGGDRFLEIAVRPFNSPNPHVILGARQQILSVPMAVRSARAATADNATNAQTAVNATNAANAVTAQNSLALGNVPASNYAQLNATNLGALSAQTLSSTGDLLATGKFSLNGDSVQVAASHGFVKALVAITASGAIARCYNGSSGLSTVPCGFTVQHVQTGHYHVDFPFSVTSRFWIVTSDDSAGTIGAHAASVGPVSANRLSIRRFIDGTQTDLPFHLLVF